MKIIKLPIEFPIDSSKKIMIVREHGEIIVRYRNHPKEGFYSGHGSYCKDIYDVLKEARWFAIKYKVLELDMWVTKIKKTKQSITFE